MQNQVSAVYEYEFNYTKASFVKLKPSLRKEVISPHAVDLVFRSRREQIKGESYASSRARQLFKTSEFCVCLINLTKTLQGWHIKETTVVELNGAESWKRKFNNVKLLFSQFLRNLYLPFVLFCKNGKGRSYDVATWCLFKRVLPRWRQHEGWDGFGGVWVCIFKDFSFWTSIELCLFFKFNWTYMIICVWVIFLKIIVFQSFSKFKN